MIHSKKGWSRAFVNFHCQVSLHRVCMSVMREKLTSEAEVAWMLQTAGGRLCCGGGESASTSPSKMLVKSKRDSFMLRCCSRALASGGADIVRCSGPPCEHTQSFSAVTPRVCEYPVHRCGSVCHAALRPWDQQVHAHTPPSFEGSSSNGTVCSKKGVSCTLSGPRQSCLGSVPMTCKGLLACTCQCLALPGFSRFLTTQSGSNQCLRCTYSPLPACFK